MKNVQNQIISANTQNYKKNIKKGKIFINYLPYSMFIFV